jgi:hypothetical protein
VTPDTVIDGEYSTQGWNRFAYCKNNPIIYKDPTGHLIAGGNGGPGYAQLAEKLGEKISSAVDSVKNFFGGGDSKGGSSPVKDQMLKNLDAKAKTTKIGNTTINLNQIADPKNAIEGLSNKTADVLRDMTKKFDLSSMTISSLAREPLTNPVERDPHRYPKYNNPGGGRGVDITEVTSRNDGYARLQGMTDSDPKFRQEKAPGLANEITDYLKNDPRVKQVVTPWDVIDKTNKNRPERPNEIWTDPKKASSIDWQHKNHLHFGT